MRAVDSSEGLSAGMYQNGMVAFVPRRHCVVAKCHNENQLQMRLVNVLTRC